MAGGKLRLSRTSSRRFSSRKRLSRGGGRSLISSPLRRSPRELVPSQLRRKFVYTQLISETTSAAINSNVFSGNGMFDPDLTGTGQQPVGFDEYMALYERFRVVASAIKITFVSTSGGAGVYLACYPSRSSSVLADIQHIMAQPAIVMKPVGAGSTGNSTTVMTNYMTTNKMFGKWNAAQQNFAGQDTANPTNQFVWQIYILSHDQSANTATGSYVVEITYDAILSDPQVLDVS